MVRALYHVFIFILDIFFGIAAVFNIRISRIKKGRKHWKKNLNAAVDLHGQGMLWFHCASLGEFEQGRPVIERLKHDNPEEKIMLSFFSSAGYEIRKDYEAADIVIYLPSDTRSNASFFLETARPKMAIFVKYEFWYNFIHVCHELDIPMLSISSVFREGQIFFRPWGWFFRQSIGRFTHFFVQDINSRHLLQSVGIMQATVSGDTRFDRVYQLRQQPKDIPEVAGFCRDTDVMVIGSSWPSDIRLLEDLLHDISVPLKFIIAPHLTDQNSLRGLENVLKVPYARFSQKENLTGIRILIVDTIGLLSSLYRYGKMAYVGGAFSRGIHNVLEPAVFGIPVLFGDHSSNMKYREVSGLINSGGGFPVANQAMVKGVIHRLLSNQELYHAAASAAGTYVVNNTGATDKIVSFIHRLQSPN